MLLLNTILESFVRGYSTWAGGVGERVAKLRAACTVGAGQGVE